MGDPACWLHLTCASCGAVSDDLDAARECPSCRRPRSGQASIQEVDDRVDVPQEGREVAVPTVGDDEGLGVSTG